MRKKWTQALVFGSIALSLFWYISQYYQKFRWDLCETLTKEEQRVTRTVYTKMFGSFNNRKGIFLVGHAREIESNGDTLGKKNSMTINFVELASIRL